MSLDLQSRLEGLSNTVDEIHLHQRDKQRDREFQTVLNWLTPVNYATQQNDFIAQRQEGTGEWVINSSKFQNWLEDSNHTLFCPGIPGAGKTIITSTVVRHLHERFRNDPSVGIAYVYCTFKQQKQQTPVDLMTIILKQLAMKQDTLPSALESLYHRLKSSQARPSLKELKATIKDVAIRYSRIFIIIDALDECRSVDDGLDMLIQNIIGLQAEVKANLFATSRLIESIESKFKKAIRLEIRAHGEDIKMYLENRLQDCQSLTSQSTALRERIKDSISMAVDGMYVFS